ncbi:MAG TPA: DsbA family protein [Solirubrobacteraceae bacterium]|nr:DsbA family protein [Solirubrobacteraceae bacterium]
MAPALRTPSGAFYFDLASPLAYLAAERALRVLSSERAAVQWRPVLAAGLPGGETFEAFRCGTEADIFREEVERRARELGLQELRWPEPFPFDSAAAMRVATFAASIGRALPFAQAAFRQAFAGGRSLEEPDNVLIAAAACEMHPRAVLAAIARESLQAELDAATREAALAGVRDVPAVLVEPPGGGARRVLHGERSLEEAGMLLRGEPPQPTGEHDAGAAHA